MKKKDFVYIVIIIKDIVNFAGETDIDTKMSLARPNNNNLAY